MATLYASADQIRARAAQLDPVKVLIALIGAPFFALFYVARFVWLAVSLVLASGLVGWEAADRSIGARRADARGG